MSLKHAADRPRYRDRHAFVTGGLLARGRGRNRAIAGLMVSALVAAGLVFASTAQAAPFRPEVTLGSSGVAPAGILAGENETLKLSVANGKRRRTVVQPGADGHRAERHRLRRRARARYAHDLSGPHRASGRPRLRSGRSKPVGLARRLRPARGGQSEFRCDCQGRPTRPNHGRDIGPDRVPGRVDLRRHDERLREQCRALLPIFPGSTGKGGDPASAATIGGNAPVATTGVTAIRVTKSEPSPEGELLRGVHDNTTPYTISVENSHVGPTSGVKVVDFIPAGLEFLGCGLTENSPRGPSNRGAGLGATPKSRLPHGIAEVETVETRSGRSPGSTPR